MIAVMLVAALSDGPAVPMLQSDPRAAAIELAKAELARTAQVDSGSIDVVDAVATEWRDSSLGCVQRGVVAAPVITPGFIVTLRSQGRSYKVHVGAGRAVQCGNPTGQSPGKLAQSDNAIGLQRAEEAREDLARTLGVPADRVTIDFFRQSLWPDSRLGCPGVEPASPQPTRGFLIQLTSGGKAYEYRSALMGAPRRCDGSSPRRP